MGDPSNPLRTLRALGQSVWFDNIHRAMIDSGELEQMIRDDDLAGITSNPSIFEKAIAGGAEYDAAIRSHLGTDPALSPRELFFRLAVEDIQGAADRLRPVYDASASVDGMVSLEVSPDLAHDTAGTIEEALDLHRRLERPNVMIKVPATKEGVPAFEELTARGLNVNVTLLFSVDRYLDIARAYVSALRRRRSDGLDVGGIASVASFFVSRVDSALDPLLEARGASEIMGCIAIANAKLAYLRSREVFGDDFADLRSAGAAPQRLLWASTSTKNPKYSDVLYVDSLVGPGTVNTIPPDTYSAYKEHGTPSLTLAQGLDEAVAQLASLEKLGIDIVDVTDRLEREGVAAFANAFDTLIEALKSKTAAIAA